MQIYRGHDLAKTDTGWTVSKDGELLHTAPTDEAAMDWVDAERRKLAQSKQTV